MKNILVFLSPIRSAAISLLVVTAFFRIYLYIYTNQVVTEFNRQNTMEISSGDSFKMTTKLNALSSVTNWVCIVGNIQGKEFYNLKRGSCRNGLLQQTAVIKLEHANNFEIKIIMKFPKEVELLFALFFTLQAFVLLIVISSTRKSEEEKRSYEIKINKMARQMSHDIRSPLATLNTIIKEGELKNFENRDLLHKSLSRINEISNKLLNQSYNNQVDELPKVESYELVDIIEGLVDEKKIEYKNVNFTISSSIEKFFSKIDKVEFNRILSNLINNSVEASADSIKINVDNNEDFSKIKISIADNGKGMPPEILSQLGNSEISTKKRGNGLGVMHAVESVRAWGGEFIISSEPDSGSVVNLVLVNESDLINVIDNLYILLDNDELVRDTWKFKARKSNINLMTFSRYEDLLSQLDNFHKYTKFFIDSDLGSNISGDEVALNLHMKGFKNITMASGRDKSYFKELAFLKDVIGKKPPF